MTNARSRFWLCLAAVTALYAFHVSLKLAKITAAPTWSATEEVGQFWSEFAFHYRFAKFFAQHPLSDWGELRHDRSVQYPDDMDDWAEFTVAMEVPVGVLYRWMYGVPGTVSEPPQSSRERQRADSPAPDPLTGARSYAGAPPFHVWVVWYDCLVSSLTLFAVFFLGRAVWRSDWAGLAASLLYAPLYPSYGRTVRNLFLREDFAVPLIVAALWLTMQLLGNGEGGRPRKPSPSPSGGGERTGDSANVDPWRGGLLAALVWLAALASWHLTQFVLVVFVGALVLVWLAGWLGEDTRGLRWLVAGLAVGGVLVPVLRAKQFYLSPVMGVLYGWVLAEWLDGSWRKRLAVLVGTTGVVFLAGLVLGKSVGEYGHVYELFFYKLRFLGVKPIEPARLPWEARCLWEGAFNTAGRSEWWHSLLWCGPLAAVGAWQIGRMEGWKSGRLEGGKAGAWVWAVFTLLLVPLSWMVVRYFTFLGFAAAVLAAGCVTRRLWGKVVCGVAIVWEFALLNQAPLPRLQPTPAEYRPVVAWIQEHTATNAVILAHITESPVFLAATGRPIIMHPKFENREIRDRYREMLAAVYGDEASFYAFCRRYGAAYFIYDSSYLYAGRDSRRYKADRLGELPDDCVARLFAERPERLRRFTRELSTPRFTVFRVLE